MAEEIEEQQHLGGDDEISSPDNKSAASAADTAPPPQDNDNYTVSLNIWPPSQRTRDAVITRLVQTLSAPSVLSKRYGTVPEDEAAAAARRIEEAAFSAASAVGEEDGGPRADTVDGGIEILQIYSKEISGRMLQTVKARAAAAAVPVASLSPESGITTAETAPIAIATEEEAQSVESEVASS